MKVDWCTIQPVVTQLSTLSLRMIHFTLLEEIELC